MPPSPPPPPLPTPPPDPPRPPSPPPSPPPPSGVRISFDVTLSGSVIDWDGSTVGGAALRLAFCEGVEEAVSETAAVCTVDRVESASAKVAFELFFTTTSGLVEGAQVASYATSKLSAIASHVASKTGLSVSVQPTVTGSSSSFLPPSPPPPYPTLSTGSSSSGSSGGGGGGGDGSASDPIRQPFTPAFVRTATGIAVRINI
ncbi:hypothetical protein T492DRAFT_849150 [Pavlovales sp. CCMP2436]|nr:hypothetical protein T492DRAFT_849150 [Pavlovales sp. CCMP2436]